MSTRRARIKAVTSLPVRRKNVENCDNSKNKPPEKETIAKTPKSPRTPQRAPPSQEKDEKPVIKTATPVSKTYETLATITRLNSDEESQAYEEKVSVDEYLNTVKTPQRASKVSVITPNLSYKPSTTNPTSDAFPSPHVPSPKGKPARITVEISATPVVDKVPEAHTIDENNELHITSLNVNSVNHNNVSSRSVVLDDYINVPSVPESVENEGVMDGIVPLQAEPNMPKPIDLLKNEIISENAEVLFDPIVPLPSPTKVRPKLKPTPRLDTLRRNSIQGSASDSEDEIRRPHLSGASTPLRRQRRDSQSSLCTLNSVSKKATGRTRNNSVCSNASQSVSVMTATSPSKEKQTSANKRREVCRRMAAVRRRQETLKRETLTMYDLIFYNPTTNPIIPDQDEVKAKEENIKEELEREKEKLKKEEEKPAQKPAADGVPVPQIKLGPNGEIVLDKTSLVINQTDANRDVSLVREGAWATGNGRYTRSARSADWSACETVRFYRALAAIGTDFSLMAPLFPDRTRRELKVKFKKEEKINGAQVDKALRMRNSWDPNRLKEEFQGERVAAANKAKREAEKLKEERLKEKERIRGLREVRVRNSRAAKALGTTMLPGITNQKFVDLETVDDIVNRALLKKSKIIDEPDDPPPVPMETPASTSMATLTLINNGQVVNGQTQVGDNMATLSRVSTPVVTEPLNLNALPNAPHNIENGSLVVLTVNDPSSPSKKMLQTYIADSAGRLTPIALNSAFLSSVVGYMKKGGTPKSTVSTNSSPLLTSPASVVSQDSRTGTTPINSSPVKRQRMSSFTMMQL